MTRNNATIRVLIPLKLRKKKGRPKNIPPADYDPSEDQTQIGEDPALHLRIDVDHPGLDGIVGAHAGNTDLANAATVVVRRLDVQSKEAERAFGER